MWLFISFSVFGIFILNVTLGAIAETTILGDVGEMLVLFVATIFFVVAILKKEAGAKNEKASDQT